MKLERMPECCFVRVMHNEIIKTVGKSKSCMVSKLPIIFKRTVHAETELTEGGRPTLIDRSVYQLNRYQYRSVCRLLSNYLIASMIE